MKAYCRSRNVIGKDRIGDERRLDRPSQRRAPHDVPQAERGEDLAEPQREFGTRLPVGVQSLEQQNAAADVARPSLLPDEAFVEVGLVEERDGGGELVAQQQSDVRERQRIWAVLEQIERPLMYPPTQSPESPSCQPLDGLARGGGGLGRLRAARSRQEQRRGGQRRQQRAADAAPAGAGDAGRSPADRSSPAHPALAGPGLAHRGRSPDRWRSYAPVVPLRRKRRSGSTWRRAASPIICTARSRIAGRTCRTGRTSRSCAPCSTATSTSSWRSSLDHMLRDRPIYRCHRAARRARHRGRRGRHARRLGFGAAATVRRSVAGRPPDGDAAAAPAPGPLGPASRPTEHERRMVGRVRSIRSACSTRSPI